MHTAGRLDARILGMSQEPQQLLQTSKFTVVRQTQTTPAGKTKTREIVRHPGACVIVPLLSDGRVCLIRNYRIAVAQTLIELRRALQGQVAA